MSTFEEPQQHGYIPFAQPEEHPSAPRLSSNIVTRMWQTRPVRLPSKQGGRAKVAGVCEGIGVRYQIDPVLIRLFFVVSGFFGAGLGIYLLAWMCMPRYSVPVSPVEALWTPGHSQDRTHGIFLLIGFVFFSGLLSSNSSETYSIAGFLSYGLFFTMLWALHKRQPIPPRGLLTTEFDFTENTENTTDLKEPTMNNSNQYPQPQPNLSDITPVEGYYAPFAQQSPETPDWAPLDHTQQNAWNMEFSPAPMKKKKRIWPWVLGGVVGTGTIMMLAAGALLFSSIDNEYKSVEDVLIAPSNADLEDSYTSGIGDLDLDLSNLQPLDTEHEIEINSGIGEISVILPDDVPVSLTCTTGVGSSNCEDFDVEAHNEGLESPELKLLVTSGIGDVNIENAN